ncbi:acyl-CoA dehydrogenase family protein [Thalassovita sp.]|uniref:acyl-CoA dehydrogenase family protein n=1 Tax=Thalassovita sp. TaxID=1979401 RepID=UPI0029DE7D2F|nr:acyl-CoA dehydrogenase family protein [Thalassovita sp.]
MSEEWVENARMIVESARAIVPADGSLERVRKLRFNGPGYDRTIMAKAGELGLFLMRVSDDAGGLGLGMRETCELARILGRGLLPEPVLPAIMAGALLQKNMSEEAMTGAQVLTWAWQDALGTPSWNSGAEGRHLKGRKLAVQGAAGADLFAVVTGQGVAVLLRDAVTVEAVDSIDGGHLCSISFNTETELFPCPNARSVIADATLAHSAYLLGLSERALEITLDYLRVRKQFDRPIGSYQSLQHRATEMKIRLELSRAAIFATARRFDSGADALTRTRGAARVKLRAAELAMHVSREAIQMHGAMGITDEADIGLYVRKAMAEANLFGAPYVLRAQLSEMLDEGEAA